MDDRQALHAARARRGGHRARRRDQHRGGHAQRRHAGRGHERDERLSRRADRQDRRPQRPRGHPGLRRTARQLAAGARGSTRQTPGVMRAIAADRAAAAGDLQRPRRARARARQHARGHRPTQADGDSRATCRRFSPAPTTSPSARGWRENLGVGIGDTITHHQPAGPRRRRSARCRARSATPSPRSSRSASTITTRPSSSCRSPTRRRCC